VKPLIKKLLISFGGLLGLAALGLGGYVFAQVSAFDASLSKIYSIPVPQVHASNSPEAIARGDHLAHSLGGCTVSECHGPSLGGGKEISAGPVGTIGAPNITSGGLGAVYSDGELMRLIEHGVRKDGKTVRFMSSHEINWLPQDDILAIIAYVRSVAAVEGPGASLSIGLLGKVLDRRDQFALDIARRIDHEHIQKAPAPAPTKEYGRYIAKLCMGCHGETYSGGPIPGAPPDMPIPANITPHGTGLKGWTYEAFERLADQGLRNDGQKVDPFMPIEVLAHMNETERKALYAYLVTLEPKPFGNR